MAVAPGPSQPTAVAQDARAAVTLRVELAANHYRNRLRGDTTRVAAKMVKAIRPALDRFGFLNWDVLPSVATDTITLRLFQLDARPRHVRLEVSAHGSNVPPGASFTTEFEKFGTARARRVWSPDTVVAEWVGRMEAILADERGRLVSEVFGQLPLAVPVTLYPQDLQAHVSVHPDSIGAAVRPPPRFRLIATVHDTALAIPTVGEAELILAGCGEHADDGTYACNIRQLNYQDSLANAADRQELLERAEVVINTVHLFEYWPAPQRRSGPVGARRSDGE